MPRRISVPPSIRKEIKIKCRGLCCICHRSGIEFHHIDGNNSNNDPDNLIPLCRNCHDNHTNPPGLSSRLTQRELKEVRKRFYAQVPPQESNIQMITELNELKIKVNKILAIHEGGVENGE